MNLEKEANNNLELEFSPLALKDIKSTWEYLGDKNEDAAKRLIREISDKCVNFSRNPKLGRERNDLILNLRQFPHKHYNIFYFETEFGVEIYRVLHSSRNIVQVFDELADGEN